MFVVGRDEGIGSVVSRRDFLRVGGLSVVSLSVAEKAALARRSGAENRSVILLLMSGGASQLETFDPKPDAPSGIRGPLRAIDTAVPGLQFSEGLPRLAERADRLSIVRTLNHSAAAIHETGLQLLQTGRLASGGQDFPSFGAATSRVFDSNRPVPAYVVLPRVIDRTGVNVSRGQGAAFLGSAYEPTIIDRELPAVFQQVPSETLPALDPDVFACEKDAVRRGYGETRFGRLCCRARQLIERGVAVVTVNLFDRLYGQVTWDAHAAADAAPGTLFDYRDQLCPEFDKAAAALLDDLSQRGLWQDTLVVAVGEFGRTPRLNPNGGRDHWSNAWSAMLAGGKVPGGQVIGSTDACAGSVIDQPVDPSELTATIYHHLGIDPHTELTVADGSTIPLLEADPLRALGDA
ncbi:MAG: hypothetical protein CMJ65_18165 [Planctomycetaceae bacterium]|jgi:hypothetical protein|nr:hypothetical protein [Planctomycetaceae bacterium]